MAILHVSGQLFLLVYVKIFMETVLIACIVIADLTSASDKTNHVNSGLHMELELAKSYMLMENLF